MPLALNFEVLGIIKTHSLHMRGLVIGLVSNKANSSEGVCSGFSDQKKKGCE